MQTFCPKHFTLEDIDCEEPIVACPPRVELDPTKHLIVTCGPCDRTRVVPIARVMQGTVRASGTCVLSTCAATVLLPDAGINAIERLAIKLEGIDPAAANMGIDQAAPVDFGETGMSYADKGIANAKPLGEVLLEDIREPTKPRSPKKAGPAK